VTAITGVGPGDVLAVRVADVFGEVIRFGAGLIDLPNLSSHIAVLDHQDKNGTWWAIEGRPGGVGWQDATAYLNSPHTITNRNQAKTIPQRNLVCAGMKQALGTGYDDLAIVEDGMRDVGLQITWDDMWKTTPGAPSPAHVVCSSVAVWMYHLAKLLYPANVDMAHVQPGDWDKFILENRYE
jgi:hypothetical protein